MGGPSPSAPSLGAAPATPTPLNYSSILSQATQGGGQQYSQMLNSLMGAYKPYQDDILGSVNTIAKGLRNDPYTQAASNAVGGMSGLSSNAMQNAGANSAGQQMLNMAGQQMQLGGSLTPEQQRMASQSALGSYAGNGLATGDGASGAEMLSRFGASNAMQQQRMGNVANAYSVVNQNEQNAGNIANQTANANMAVDPYSRALGYGINLGSNIMGTAGSMIGNAYAGQNQLAGDVASYNGNMQSSLYNSYMNNQAGMYGAQLQANATGNSALMGLGGAGLGAAAGIGAAVII